MSRSIRTTFFNRKHVAVQNNSSTDSNRAVTQCVAHMQLNRYGATAAEVYDTETGEVHAQVKRSMNGTITITYQRDPRAYERRLSLQAFANLK